ncbi:MAG: hypothetical protein IEMM0001_1574 [bacterium]|nr:MAG: hypothetical protein IEMM0001_1574 [bacterium]
MLDHISNLLLVHKDERQQLSYLLIVFILMGAGIALGRGTADALFFKRYGIEYLPVMFVLVGVLLSAISVMYAAFVDALPSERFFKIIFALMIALLLGNWFMIRLGASDMVYPAYFLLYEIASELFLVHSALYLGQNLVQTQSKRLMPIILAGSQVGVIIGGLFLAGMSRVLGVQNMLLVWALLLAVTLAIITVWHSKKGVSPYFRAGRKERSRLRQSINQVTQGLKFMKTSQLLKVSSFALFFMVILTYVLGYTLNRIYTDTFETEVALGSFFGLLTAMTSALALIMQIFISNRVIRRFGVKKVNLVYPVTSFMVYLGLMFSFTLPFALIGSFNKDSIMPAFRRPVRNIFMDSLPMQIQGRARAMSIVVVLPLALATAGIFLWFAQKAENPSLFLFPGLLVALVYLWFNRKMNKAYAREIVKNLKQRLFVPEHQMLGVLDGADNTLLKDIEKGVLQEDEEISIAYSSVLSKAKPERAVTLLPRRMLSASVATKDKMIRMLQPLGSEKLCDKLRREIGHGDTHLDATLYKALFESGDQVAQQKLTGLLRSESPRLCAAGILGVLIYPVPELCEQAKEEWVKLLSDSRPEYYIPGIELAVPGMENYYLREPFFGMIQQVLVQMLDQPISRFQIAALKMIANWPTDNFKAAQASVIKLSEHEDWKVRREVIHASHILSYDEHEEIVHRAIEDHHPDVREASVKSMAARYSDPRQWLISILSECQFGSPRARQAMIEYLIEYGTSAEVLQSISVAMAENALQMHNAIKLLDEEEGHFTPGIILLRHAIEERMHELIDLSLLALQSSTHDSDIEVIRAGLKSRDRRHFSNACELLSMISHGRLISLLMHIFEGTGDSHPGTAEDVFTSIDDILKWIADGTDPWLNECAAYLNTTLSSKSYA